MDGRAIDTSELLTHAAWVRRLAWRLVRDAATADDVAQAAWLEALERPPRHGGNPRAWLGRVVRNAARQHGRAETRRVAREERAARSEELEETAELVARAELQHEVVEHVLALEPPYREVVLLRFFDDLPPRAIARRTGAPVATVHTRLQRALARLRERLDRSHGDRASWCVALLPLARRGAPAVQGSLLATLAGWTLAMKLSLALAALVLAAVALVVLLPEKEPAAFSAESRGGVASELALPGAEPTASPAPEPASPAPEPARVAAATPETDGPAQGELEVLFHAELVRGRLVDVEGRPIAGAELRWSVPHRPRIEDHRLLVGADFAQALSPALEERLRTVPGALAELLLEQGAPAGELPGGFTAPTTRTAADGTFELVPDARRGRVELADDALVIVGHGERVVGGERERTWVAAHAVDVTGTVVDEERRPIAGAHVDAFASIDALPAFPHVLSSRDWLRRPGSADPQGRFRFDRLPAGVGELLASAPGHRLTRVAVPATDGQDLTIVLQPEPALHRPVLAGLVLDPAGQPAPDVVVRFGEHGVSTDGLGRFELEVPSPRAHGLVAVSGGAVALSRDVGRWLVERPDDPALRELVLRLEPALTIRGRVLRADGSPWGGVGVGVADPTVPWSTAAALEQLVAGASMSHFEPLAVTDARGDFELSGLLDRAYRPSVVDLDRGFVWTAEPVAAGALDVVLRVPADAWREELTGRVVSRRGEPVASAGVSIRGIVADTGRSRHTRSLAQAVTNESGRFAFGPVARYGVHLGVSGPGIAGATVPLPPDAPNDGTTIVVDFECRFRLDAASPAQRLAVLDADGEPMILLTHRPGTSIYHDEVSRRDGAFPVCTVTDAAATLVLYDESGVEIGRQPLDLRPGELQVVGP